MHYNVSHLTALLLFRKDVNSRIRVLLTRFTKIDPPQTMLILMYCLVLHIFCMFEYCFQSFQKLWCNERLMNIMEQILGPEVAGHPVWNLRTKTPNSRAVDIPWHQGKHGPKKPNSVLNVVFLSNKNYPLSCKLQIAHISAMNRTIIW